jgi:hypothetical protein
VLVGCCECTVLPALTVSLTCCLRAPMPFQVEDNARALEQIEAALADLRNDIHKQLAHSDKTRASQSATTTAKPTTVSGDAPLHRGDGSDDNDDAHGSKSATGDAVSTDVPGTRALYCWRTFTPFSTLSLFNSDAKAFFFACFQISFCVQPSRHGDARGGLLFHCMLHGCALWRHVILCVCICA